MTNLNFFTKMLAYLAEAIVSKSETLNFHSVSCTYFLWVVCTICLSATFWSKKSKWQHNIALLEKLPGPKKYPVVGSLLCHEIRYIIRNPTKLCLDCMEKLTKTYGNVFCAWIMNEPKVFISDAELATKLFNDGTISAKASDVQRAAKVVGGEGLIVLEPSIHTVRRRQWMPSFSRSQIENSIQFFNQQAIRLCDELRQHQTSGEAFNMLPLIVGCTFRAICYSAFGEEYMNTLHESVSKTHMHDLHTVGKNLTVQALTPWFKNYFVFFYGTPQGWKTRKCVKRANMLTKQAVQERQKIRAKRLAKNSSQDAECFLDHMLNLLDDRLLTVEEVVQELNVFIVGGYDTSAISITYLLFFLSFYPEHQQKIVDELCSIIPSEYWGNIKQYSITAAMTKQMKHLELCIKETLRLYPAVPISLRSTTTDVELPDGRVIPKDVDVYVMLNQIQRDPKNFPEPEKFIPERHLEPNAAFMPFALGSRNCIGQTYGIYEMKVIIAYLLMEYKWETIEKLDFPTTYLALLVPENGLRFKVSKRVF